MRILHTEASSGWGGQELRILNEAKGMRARGHTIIFIVQAGGRLAPMAREAGFLVYEVLFRKRRAFWILRFLLRVIKNHKVEIINTHSSLDAWLGGLAGRLLGKKVIRTRHLSTPIRGGLNSLLLYNYLATHVVTTCQETAALIRVQAKLAQERISSIPTGIDPNEIQVDAHRREAFRAQYGIEKEECLVGTLCVLRGWKGVADLLHAAHLLRETSHLKWMIIGSGVSESYFREIWRELKLEKKVIFAGHHYPPYAALDALDVFMLLSTANEGVSQSSLQAGYLEKPLITTPTGGLKEVCLDGKTGFQVPIRDHQAIASAVLKLSHSEQMRRNMGHNAKEHVLRQFSFSQMLDQMEKIYAQ